MRHVLVVIVLALMTVLPLAAQAPEAAEQKQLAALAKEVHAQQVALLSNQTKIETKLAEIAEIIRVARLYSGRTH